MRKITLAAAALVALAAASSAIAAIAARSGTTDGDVETVTGVSYHSVGFDKSFNPVTARLEAWNRANEECTSRGGYIADLQAGAKRPIITALNGLADVVYVTCRTDRDMSAPSDPFMDDIIPVAKVNNAPNPVVTATGSPRTAYISVRDRAVSVCKERGERIQHMNIGFNTDQRGTRATAHLTCAR